MHDVHKVSINPIIQSKSHLINDAHPPTCNNIIYDFCCINRKFQEEVITCLLTQDCIMSVGQAQSFLVPGPAELSDFICCLTSMGAEIVDHLCQHSHSCYRGPRTHDHIFLLLEFHSVSLVSCCWPSPAQLFLVLSRVGLTVIFFFLTTMGSCN
jgi:hypothetical protein